MLQAGKPFSLWDWLFNRPQIPFRPSEEIPAIEPVNIPYKKQNNMLTLTQLNAICPAIKGVRGQNIVDAINNVTPLYKMDGPGILEEFIPNLLEESGEFSKFEENLNYSIKGLYDTFSRSRISANECSLYGRIDGKRGANKVAIGNSIYGGAFGITQLGNTKSGDGYLFRGSGPMQNTGRGNITAFTGYYNKLSGTNYTPEQMADMLRDITNIKLGIHSACWFFAVSKNLIQKAVNNEFIAICIKINGGKNGLDRRQIYYQRAIKVLR